MDKLPFPAPGLNGSEVDSILEIYNRLSKLYSVTYQPDFSFEFMNFEHFRSYQNVAIGPTVDIQTPFSKFSLAFIQVVYRLPGGKYTVSVNLEFQTYGILLLKKNAGHILIRPETLADKIQEFVAPIELDFKDDKAFSRKFYVRTSDKLKATQLINTKFRDLIKNMRADNIVIEIHENMLIIGNKKKIDPHTALAFATFLNSVSQSF